MTSDNRFTAAPRTSSRLHLKVPMLASRALRVPVALVLAIATMPKKGFDRAQKGLSAKRLRTAAQRDKDLLAEIQKQLQQEEKSGRVPLRDIDRHKASNGGV
ncbi:MAG: hypothetical protein WEE64_07615 [Dehalococcoidia bacterium]